MKRTFAISHVKPISVNATLIPGFHGGFAKSSASTEFGYQVFYQLNTESNLQNLKVLREHFNPENHMYKVCISILYPKSEFITKKKLISSKTIDVSNFEKPIIDLLFLPKHFDKAPPEGVQNLNIDDKYITELISKKWYHDKEYYEIVIDVEILDFNIKNNVD